MSGGEKMLLCIGQLTIDDLVLPDGSTRLGTPGGNALYSVLGARLWLKDGEYAFAARIGSDYPSENLKLFQEAGLCIDALHRIAQEHIRSWILYEDNGERRALCRNRAVLPYPPISEESFAAYLSQYRALHLACSPLLSDLPKALRRADGYHLAPQTGDRHAENLRLARQENPQALISLDPSPFYMYRGNEAYCESIFSQVDILLPSREEVFSLYGDLSPEEAAWKLASMGPQLVVIKLGARGCYLYDAKRGEGKFLPAFSCKPTDCTGAGDAFCGGFLAGMLTTQEPETAARYGSISASLALQDYGPAKLLTVLKEDARQLLAQF